MKITPRRKLQLHHLALIQTDFVFPSLPCVDQGGSILL